MAERPDYVPGVFAVERHICDKWARAQRKTITLVLGDAHVIDKGIPTSSLPAQVQVGDVAALPRRQ
ncbi:hypothetical protein ABEW79_20110 [Delftia tsuruhatensis]|uniref:hypothetical protein n=1 Tax=Delftia tsuruhatensis TaxID=180282 RepID=UPI003D22E41F